jgi:hypothetical protein
VGYMDDITLGRKLSVLGDEVALLKTTASALGLVLNESKCELITSMQPPTLRQTLARFFSREWVSSHSSGLSCLHFDSFGSFTGNSPVQPQNADRLCFFHSHNALLILKYSLSIPTLLHNLRSSFCYGHRTLEAFNA